MALEAARRALSSAPSSHCSSRHAPPTQLVLLLLAHTLYYRRTGCVNRASPGLWGSRRATAGSTRKKGETETPGSQRSTKESPGAPPENPISSASLFCVFCAFLRLNFRGYFRGLRFSGPNAFPLPFHLLRFSCRGPLRGP